MKRIAWILTALFILSPAVCFGRAKGKDMAIQEGRKVSFDYVLTVDGQVVDTSKDKEPLQYVHGQGNIIPGLEKELMGLQPGEEKSVTIPPAEAYGAYNPELVQELPKSSLPEELEPRVGMPLQMKSGERVFVARIKEIKDDSVVVDLNHPLTDKTLNFSVKIISVE